MKKILYFLLLLFLIPSITYSQWTLNTSTTGRVFAMVNDPVNPDVLYAAGLDNGVNKSSNGGISWIAVNSGLTYTAVQCLAISPSNPQVLYAGTNQGNVGSGIYVTTNGGTSWTRRVSGIQETSLGIQAIAINPQNPSIAYAAVFDGVGDSPVGFYKTIDQGVTWVPSNTGMDIKNILCISINPANPSLVFAGSSFTVTGSVGPSKIYRSTDAGANWTIATGLPTDPAAINPVRFFSISTVNPSVMMAGLFMNTTDGGAYFSTDAGSTWTKKWGGAPGDVGTLLRSGIIRPGTTDEIYVGLDRSTPTNIGVWRSTNGGTSWSAFNGGAMLDTYGVRGLIFKDLPASSTLYAGVATTAGAGVYQNILPPVPVELISFSAAVNRNIVELSWITGSELNNSGFNIERKTQVSGWETIGFVHGKGTTAERNYYYYSDNPQTAGKYSYRLKQVDFNGSYEYSHQVEVEILPFTDFILAQNYPNPFNASSVISFSLPESGPAVLKVYDVLGSEAAVLIDENLNEGSYSIRFNADNLPSGIYFYTLTAGNFSQTKKMILNK